MAGPFSPFEAKMRRGRVPDVAIESFRRHYQTLVDDPNGSAGMIRSAQIRSPAHVDEVERLPDLRSTGEAALRDTLVLKLNGGLGTGMGMSGPKSLLPAKHDLTFLEVIVKQMRHLRDLHGCRLPLVLMNSFRTRDDSLTALRRYGAPESGLSSDFLQHRVPKVSAETMQPISWPADPDAEWCPPGHGDIYAALISSGLLAEIRKQKYRYLFVSNVDNLGAVLDLNVLGWFVHESVPFLMEVTTRTEADRKGGHLAVGEDGRLLLREAAQCHDDDRASFQDIERFRYFNTNSLWIDVEALSQLIEQYGCPTLPLIRKRNPVDPSRRESPEVYQLESAMGAAISLFKGSRALSVPRRRFAPVKSTNDLLGVWSDAYILTESFEVVPSPARTFGPLVVDLDSDFFTSVGQLRDRLTDDDVPSLVGCERLTVTGDVRFGRGVRCSGSVAITAGDGGQRRVEDGEHLRGS